MEFSPSGLPWWALSPGGWIRGVMCGPPGGVIGQSGAWRPTRTSPPAWAPTGTTYPKTTNSTPLALFRSGSYPAARRSSMSCSCPMTSASADRGATGRDRDELLILVDLELDVGVGVRSLLLPLDLHQLTLGRVQTGLHEHLSGRGVLRGQDRVVVDEDGDLVGLAGLVGLDVAGLGLVDLVLMRQTHNCSFDLWESRTDIYFRFTHIHLLRV